MERSSELWSGRRTPTSSDSPGKQVRINSGAWGAATSASEQHQVDDWVGARADAVPMPGAEGCGGGAQREVSSADWRLHFVYHV